LRGSRDPGDPPGRKLRRQRQAVGAGCDNPRVEHRLHRRVRRQRCPAGDGERSRHVGRRDSVAGQRLYALSFGVLVDRGRRRRSFRPPPHLRHRHHDLCCGFTGLRAVGQHGPAHSGARDSRYRGGAADPVLAGDHRRDLRGIRARQGDRDLGRIFCRRRRRRPVPRRHDRRSLQLALDFSHQPAAGSAYDLDCPQPCAGKPRRRGQGRIGLARLAAGVRRAGKPRLWAHFGAGRRLARRDGAVVVARRLALAGGLHLGGSAQPQPDAAARAVPVAHIQRRQRVDAAALCPPSAAPSSFCRSR